MLRKLTLAGSLAALGLFAGGCVITDYGLMTDAHIKNVHQDGVGFKTAATNGQALIRETSRVATLFADRSEFIMTFVDQDADGNRTHRSKTLTTGAEPGQYYWTGAIYNTPDSGACTLTVGDDPQVGDADPFDYTLNEQCDGIDSLSVLVSVLGRYTEIGAFQRRAFPMLDGTSITDSQMLSILDGAEPVQMNGRDMLKLVVNADTVQNLAVSVRPVDNPDAQAVQIPVSLGAGSMAIYVDPAGDTFDMAIDLSDRASYTVANGWLNAVDAARAALGTNGSIQIVGVSGTLFGVPVSGAPDSVNLAIPGEIGLDTMARRMSLQAQWLAPWTPVDGPAAGDLRTAGSLRLR